MNSKVIYTCLVGDYDELCQPLIVDNSFDYICFSNDIKEKSIGVWNIRRIPSVIKDKARLSRYVKLQPHKVLAEYDYSLWIDANIQITGKELYTIVDDKVNQNGLIYQVNHCIPPCDCIYDEMKYAYLCGKSNFLDTYFQFVHLKSHKFPKHYGLFENNILLRRHNDLLVKRISEMWWQEYMRFSKRDQFSLMYIYWKNRYYPSLLFGDNECTRNVSYLEWNYHKADLQNGNDNQKKKLSSFFSYFSVPRRKLVHLFDIF